MQYEHVSLHRFIKFMNTFLEYVIRSFLHSSLIVFASIQRDIVSYFSISSSTSSLLIGKFCTFWTMSLIVDRFIPSSWDFNALVVLKDFIINNLFQDNNMYHDFLLQTSLPVFTQVVEIGLSILDYIPPC